MPTMGFDMLVSGEGAGGEAGYAESMKYLDEVGIGLAGYGANAGIARTPVLQHTTKGTHRAARGVSGHRERGLGRATGRKATDSIPFGSHG